MTREEAIAFGKRILLIAATDDDKTAIEFTKMAIQALSQEPCDDAISREAVIEWLKDKDIIKLSSQEETARKELKALPSVTQKSGKWIIKDRYYHDTITAECSECRREVEMSAWTKEDMYDFCPNCGARMESEDKECTKKI